ncbi:hypothetical protein, variant [Capsaspora owczarzaki ATCC 30864]|nr:hypothetical protein, variant [Capsaspora owczarzaki ATCC 30864]
MDDKTFGLKNKKGKKQQDFIANVQKSIDSRFNSRPTGMPRRPKDDDDDLERDLFKPVLNAPVQQKVAVGADPMSVVCAFFKAGTCQKGNKCRFSHDLALERKGEKRSIYGEAAAEGTSKMDEWSQEQLQEAVEKKHGTDNAKKNATDIVCKYFLEAIEKNLYGWFWECPSGEKCIYKHALPPGFVLKRDAKQLEKEEISLEELIESERANLASKHGGKLTPVTLESFLAWKEKQLAAKKETQAQEMKKQEETAKAGRGFGLSGRTLFAFRPDLFQDDDEADDETYVRETDTYSDEEETPQEADNIPEEDETAEDDESEAAASSSSAAGPSSVAIDESLFDAEDDDDDEA